MRPVYRAYQMPRRIRERTIWHGRKNQYCDLTGSVYSVRRAVDQESGGPGALRPATSRLYRLLSLRRESLPILIVIAYLVLTRCNLGEETTFGVTIADIPIFLTDVVLSVLLLVTAVQQPARLAAWAVSGVGAGPVGGAAWAIFVVSVVHAIVAFPDYQIYALRDLAVFAYSLFFPLTYFAVNRRSSAVRLSRYFVYMTLFGGLLLLAEAFSGSSLGLFERAYKALGAYSGVAIEHPATGDLGANLGFGLAALIAYALLDKQSRALNIAAAIICLTGLVISLDRSAMFGVALATVVTCFLVDRRRLARLSAVSAVLFALLLVAAALPDQIPGGHVLRGSMLALSSSASGSTVDADFLFRVRRWTYVVQLWAQHPIVGVGFGIPILPSARFWGTADEPGQFNFGMPHNSYLTVLARTGLVGFILFAFCLLRTAWDLFTRLRGQLKADELAVMNILAAMSVYAGLNLFFERPLLCGPFWIMLAVAARMGGCSYPESATVANAASLQRDRAWLSSETVGLTNEL